ncbi:hypothetical protein SERLADRAFT_442128 [Serpula lacrymans var. lacrymans S7.9]|uniref:Peptidase S54 rhomboid domain-containing protein n=1 Tax=Serpula lacrymans var. lacrymans (strain S7.9) TaxID=578457 RepID=F8P8M8_SERL9|nr:uncharacterized protein SERLADRAFT_442128 [Serpula lacrymans var. lacrymans S7.9]EGO20784.1 hypothetical protein SERLADRAFT_442128 [Serpula lacrymans var. lacrymans S7.9]
MSEVAKSAAGATAKEILPSLGASGAIYAAVTLSALAFPDASISLIFLPFFAIPIQSGVGAIIALDAIGILRGWKMFDHYAHLSGATFGVLYYLYGPQWWDSMRIIHDPTEEEKEKSEA